MRNYNTMLHMKLNAAVSFFSIAAAFSVFLLPSNAYGGICFLPDCNLGLPSYDDVNSDTKWCEDHGYYFRCPDGTGADYFQRCYRDESYTKCTEEQWCKDKGYDKTEEYCRSLGDTWYADESTKCPNGQNLYKECKEDTGRACEEDNKFLSCAVGRPSKNDDEICEWNDNYSECCTDEPSYNCPENSKVEGCEDGVIVGEDSCGYECHQCCTDSCPAGYAYTDEETSGGTSGYLKDMANEDDYCMHCTRGKLYKRKENPCTGYDVCSNYGGVDNGDYCYSGDLKKYSKCLTECRPGYIEWCDTPVTDCEKLGYKYDKSVCDGLPAVACPFNKDKWFCDKYSNIPTSGSCCGDSHCGSSEDYCQSTYGESCYNRCMRYYPDCSDMQASCRASGGISRFQNCYGSVPGSNIILSTFTCE